jgi:hypothetical protein
MIKYELLKFQDRLFYVYRRIKSTSIKMEYLEEIKKYWLCDLVLRASTDSEVLIFLREIPDLEIID